MIKPAAALLTAMLERRRFIRLGAGFAASVASLQSLPMYAEALSSADKPLPTPHELETLTRMAMMLFPHDGLADDLYMAAMQVLIQQNRRNPEVINTLRNGVQLLDSDKKISWIEGSIEQRRLALEAIEDTPFFRLVRAATIEYLYRNPHVQGMLGYEGASTRFGGYLHRGLNDIDWLPET